jgi:hypothetical protein
METRSGNEVTFPIEPSEVYLFVVGVFLAQVADVFYRMVEQSGDPWPLSEQTKHRHITAAIRQIAESFPVSIRSKFEAAAEQMAAQMIGGAVLLDRRPR